MAGIVIQNGQIFTPMATYRTGTVLIQEKRIVRVCGRPMKEIPHGLQVIDAEGLRVEPGFIDLQVNGFFGCDITEEPEAIPKVAHGLLRFGVTGFLPTIVSPPSPEVYRRAAPAVREAKGKGAEVLGLHYEGPYINPAHAGAHDKAFLRLPADADGPPWEDLSSVRLVTLAPELPGAPELISHLRAAGVTVAIGHSDATYAQAKAAFDAGARFVTHLCDAMRPFHHREPGVLGAALEDGRAPVSLIVDGVHLHPTTVRLAWWAKTAKGIALITDAIAAAGQGSGTYRFAHRTVTVDAGAGTARLPDGTLAGSTLTMDKAVRNLVAFTECAPWEAFVAASTTPAAVIGLGGRKGWLRPGYDADIVVLTPDLRVVGTIVAGELRYWAGEPERIREP